MERLATIERAICGDHDAFAELVRGSAPRLDGAARLIVRDPELARDAVQDALIRAWRDIGGLRDPQRFDAWLHRLTVNACLDQLRLRKRRVLEVELTPLHELAHRDHAGRLADRDALDAALRQLDPSWRAIVVMHHYLGMPLPEIAAGLQIPLGTAKSRLSRALESMRHTLRSHEEPTSGGRVA